MALRRIMGMIAGRRWHGRSRDGQVLAGQHFSDVVQIADRLAHVQDYLHGRVPSLDGADVATVPVLSVHHRGVRPIPTDVMPVPGRNDESGQDLAA